MSKKLLITLDDETAKVLDSYPNKSEVIRQAVKLYNNDISTETIPSLRQAYLAIEKRLRGIEEMLGYTHSISRQGRSPQKIEEPKYEIME